MGAGVRHRAAALAPGRDHLPGRAEVDGDPRPDAGEAAAWPGHDVPRLRQRGGLQRDGPRLTGVEAGALDARGLRVGEPDARPRACRRESGENERGQGHGEKAEAPHRPELCRAEARSAQSIGGSVWHAAALPFTVARLPLPPTATMLQSQLWIEMPRQTTRNLPFGVARAPCTFFRSPIRSVTLTNSCALNPLPCAVTGEACEMRR